MRNTTDQSSGVGEIRQAIADLDRQRTQVRLGGRTFLIDIVMQAPERFSSAVRSALEAELPSLRPAVIRSRFHFRESGPVAELVRAGIPVITLVTDVPGSQRQAYVGIDNRAAGATAAYLIGQWLRDQPGNILVTLSRGFFRGEEEREMGFRGAMRSLQPRRAIVETAESDGLDESQRALVLAALRADPAITAVYSIGGGNVATVDAFATLGRTCPVFIAHDLDDDNTRLLRTAGSPPCSTTICARTCAAPATSSCRRTAPCPGRSSRGPRRSR